MLSKLALSVWRLLLKCEQEPDQGIAVKSLEFISPSAAHGRCTSQRCNKRHMFWHAKRKHFFFFLFQGLFLFLWIHWINYKAIWQDSEIASLAREEKGLLVLTHV